MLIYSKSWQIQAIKSESKCLKSVESLPSFFRGNKEKQKVLHFWLQNCSGNKKRACARGIACWATPGHGWSLSGISAGTHLSSWVQAGSSHCCCLPLWSSSLKLGVFFIESYRFQVFIHMNHYETNHDWTALSTVHTYACRYTKVISLCFPYNQVASLDMVPDCMPCPPALNVWILYIHLLWMKLRQPLEDRVVHTHTHTQSTSILT